jgi:dolichol-phosphate mannosyltransferase
VTATSDCFVSVVAPLRDAAEIVDAFLDELTAVLREHYEHWEVVLVDDGSSDETAERVKARLANEPGLRLICLSRQYGEEIAASAGLDAAIGDFVVVMWPNDDPPACVPEMVELARSGSGVVLACRQNRSGDGLLVRAGAALFRAYCARVLGLKLPPGATRFCVLSRRAVNAVTGHRARQRDLRMLSLTTGYATRPFPFTEIHRGAVRRRRRFFEQAELALSLTVRHSRHPLRLATWVGAMSALACAVHASGGLLAHAVGFAWPGSMVSLQVSGLGAAVLLLLTLIAEHVGHVLLDVDDRPLYYVVEDVAGSSPIPDEERRNVVSESELQARRGLAVRQ